MPDSPAFLFDLLVTALPILASATAKSLFVLALTCVGVFYLRRSTAGSRHLLWACALTATLLVPLASSVVPPQFVPLIALPAPSAGLVQLDRTVPTGGLSGERVAARPTTEQILFGSERSDSALPDSALPQSVDAKASIGGSSAPFLPNVFGGDFSSVDLGVLAWLFGMGVAALWYIAGHVRWWCTARLANVATEPVWQQLLAETTARVGLTKAPRLLVSDTARSPMTGGFLRPKIVIPRGALGWSRTRAELVLLHELVHIRRGDWLVHSLCRLAGVAYWCNPLVWWALRHLDRERELACDEDVLALGARPSSYAGVLLDIARDGSRWLPSTALEMARRTDLEIRLMSILNRTRMPHRSTVFAGLLLLLIGLVPALAAIHPWENPDVGIQTPTAEPEVVEPPVALPTVRPSAATAPTVAPTPDPAPPVIERVPRPEPVMAPPARPAAAAVPQPASEALITALAEMAELESQMYIFEEEMFGVEDQFEPTFSELEAAGERIEEAMSGWELSGEELAAMEALEHELEGKLEPLHKELEAEMEKFSEQMELEMGGLDGFHEAMEKVHLEMEPLHRKLELLGNQLHGEVVESMRAEAEATRARMEEVRAELEPLAEKLRASQVDMAPRMAEIQALQERMAPRREELQQRLEAARKELEPRLESHRAVLEARRQAMESEMKPLQQRMSELQNELEPFQDRMKEVQRRMEPLQRRLEAAGHRIEEGLKTELRSRIEPAMAPVVSADAPFDQVVREIFEVSSISIHDDVLTLRASRRELRAVLREQLEPHRWNASDADFSAAIDRAAEELMALEVSTR